MPSNRNQIQIVNPPLSDSPTTSLTQDVLAAWVTLNVSATTGFTAISAAASYYYLLIGNYGTKTSEIVLASAKTDTSFTVGAMKYSHSASDPVIYIPYNQVKFYGRITSGGADNLLATVNIDCSQQFTSYEYTGSTYYYFVSSYYREATTAEESGFSDEISSTTFTYYSAKKIIEAWVKKAMTKIDENPNGTLSWDNCIDLLNEGLNELITKKKQWWFLYKVDSSINTANAVEYVSKPDDVSIIDFIKVNGYEIKYVTKFRYNQYKDGGSIGGWTPSCWTNKNGKVYLFPVPNSVLPVTYEYYSLPTVITSLTQEVDKEFATMLIYFIASQAAYIRGNEKRWDKMYIYYNQIAAQQIEDITWFEQSGISTELERTSIYWFDDEYGY